MNPTDTFPSAEQRNIIDHLTGALLVMAPAGSGKTRVLAQRVCQTVEREIAEPRRILCLTFTNRAAEEMRRALRDTQKEWSGEVVIKTFHGLCAYILRAEARWVGLPSDFVIYDDEDCKLLLKKLSVAEPNDLFPRICDAKQNAATEHLSLDFPSPAVAQHVFEPLGDATAIKTAIAYQAALQRRHAMDYGDLVYCTRAILHCMPEVRARWASRFDFIQVDEMQDTHPAEYEIVQLLGAQSGNVAMIGDLSQTIYGWRGSQPEQVKAAFMHDFAPKEFTLTENYRATRVLLKAADSFAQNCHRFDGRYTDVVPAAACAQGTNIEVAACEDEAAEAQWIGQRLHQLSQTPSLPSPNPTDERPFRFSRVAILVRTHKRAQTIYQGIQRHFPKLPCVTVDKFEFYRRAEVKDALAYLRLLTNPHDQSAMRRICVAQVDDTTWRLIARDAEPIGARLIDFADLHTLQRGEPFRATLDAYDQGDMVVFDTETTGINPATDDIVEIAAQRLRCGQTVGHFHEFIRVADVGESVKVHGITNAELAEKGRPVAEALGAFAVFARGALLVGHNVGFDLKMLESNLRRCGMHPLNSTGFDTYNAARRFVDVENYRLGTLAAHFQLITSPTHRADDDVQTTVELLRELIPRIREHSAPRHALIMRHVERFLSLATVLAEWRATLRAGTTRPAELLRVILSKAEGMKSFRASATAAGREHLKRLINLFRERDNLDLHPAVALQALLDYTATASNMDQIAKNEDCVMICTVHQAKGLEFDVVFIAGAVDYEFPGYHARRNNDPAQLREEQRLFYVAMTRARRQLFISRHKQSDYGPRSPSPYLNDIGSDYTTEIDV